MAEPLKRTPLYEEHVKLGAKLVPFGGFEMPVQYPTGVSGEHRAVRERAGLFDVSHMGEFTVKGSDAEGFLNLVVANDVGRLETGGALYTVMCQEDGGIIDDLLIYKFADRYRLVVNAANIAKDFGWLVRCRETHGSDGVELIDESDQIGLLALQGPASEPILAALTDFDLQSVPYYAFVEGRVDGEQCVVSRTGYTGEDGFEIYCESSSTPQLWNALLSSGGGDGLISAGLGARDTLRLEVGYALYGNDIDESTTPLEARLGWTVKLDKSEFIGRDALRAQKKDGVKRKLSGFVLQERGFPRAGHEVRYDGEPAGTVRSGTVGPTIKQGIGTVYLPFEISEPGTELEVMIREKATPAEVVRMPFYKGGSLKR